MNRLRLMKVLNQASAFLMNQDFIPILTHFAFDKESITAYNDLQGIQINLETDLECAVPGRLMLKLLNTIAAEDVQIAQKKNHKVELSAGKTKLNLPALPPSDFVFELPNCENVTPIRIPRSVIRGMNKCLVSVGNDPTHQERNGVTWIVEPEQITLYSTDNKAISKFVHTDEKTGLNPGESVFAITPTFFCQELIELTNDYMAEDADVIMHFTDAYCVANLRDECKMFTRLIRTENVLDFESVINRVLPNPSKVIYSEIPPEFEPALERAALMVETGTGKRNTTVRVKSTEIDMLTESNFGQSRDFIEFGHDLGEFNFLVDPLLLLRAFKVAADVAILPNLIALSSADGNFTHLISHSKT